MKISRRFLTLAYKQGSEKSEYFGVVFLKKVYIKNRWLVESCDLSKNHNNLAHRHLAFYQNDYKYYFLVQKQPDFHITHKKKL